VSDDDCDDDLDDHMFLCNAKARIIIIIIIIRASASVHCRDRCDSRTRS